MARTQIVTLLTVVSLLSIDTSIASEKNKDHNTLKIEKKFHEDKGSIDLSIRNIENIGHEKFNAIMNELNEEKIITSLDLKKNDISDKDVQNITTASTTKTSYRLI